MDELNARIDVYQQGCTLLVHKDGKRLYCSLGETDKGSYYLVNDEETGEFLYRTHECTTPVGALSDVISWALHDVLVCLAESAE